MHKVFKWTAFECLRASLDKSSRNVVDKVDKRTFFSAQTELLVTNKQYVNHACPERLVGQFHFEGLLCYKSELLKVCDLDKVRADNFVEHIPDLIIFEINEFMDLMHVLY